MRQRTVLTAIVLMLIFTACSKEKQETEDVVEEVSTGMKEVETLREKVQASRATFASTPAVTSSQVDLPFSISLSEIDIGWPSGSGGLQSYVSGMDSGNRWLMLGGLTAGIHGGSKGINSFPRTSLNDSIWVVDPEARTTCSLTLADTDLDSTLQAVLATTNQQSAQIDDVLWIVGGYSGEGGVSYGYLVAVDTAGLIEAILPAESGECTTPSSILSYFSWGAVDGCEQFDGSGDTKNCALTVTGGAMEVIDDELYLVLGQRFAGTYAGGDQAPIQIYTCQISVFSPPIPNWGTTLTIGDIRQLTLNDPGDCTLVALNETTAPYNRRDLNTLPSLYLDGTDVVEAANILGGVFTSDITAYTNPIYFDARAATPDNTNQQKIGQYTAASLSIFARNSGTIYNVLLGGISSNYCTAGEPGGQCTKISDNNNDNAFGPPFIADGTVISCQGSTSANAYSCETGWQQAYLYRPYGIYQDSDDKTPVLLGADANFLPWAPNLAMSDYGVILLPDTAGDYTVGYIFGGTQVEGQPTGQPYADPFVGTDGSSSTAGKLAFEVKISVAPPAP